MAGPHNMKSNERFEASCKNFCEVNTSSMQVLLQPTDNRFRISGMGAIAVAYGGGPKS